MTSSHENRNEQADYSDKALILGLKLASGRLADLFTAKLLAVVSSIGRMAVLFAVFYGWNSGRSFSDVLLLPVTIACAAIAWLGLASDWLFFQTLHRHLVPSQTEHSLSEHTHLDTNAPLNDSNQRTFLSGTNLENVPIFFVISVVVVMQLVVAPLSFGGLVVKLPLIFQVLPLRSWPSVKKALINEIIRSMTHDSKGSDQPPAEQV